MHSRDLEIAAQVKELMRGKGPRDDAEFLIYLSKVLEIRGFRHAGPVKEFDHLARLPMATEDTFKQDVGNIDKHDVVFRTSGTTQKVRGVRRVCDYDLYRISVQNGFRRFCLYQPKPETIISLVPSASARPDSSLSHMVSIVAARFFKHQYFFRESPDIIDHEDFWYALDLVKGPVFIFATQSDLNSAIFRMKQAKIRFNLPFGSRLLFTGGPKGRGNLAGPARIIALAKEFLGIDPQNIIQEFGMTELFSQSYDVGDNEFRSVPWLRSLVVDPISLRVVPVGKQGLLLHIDLANCLSWPVILSSDIAIRTQHGFRPLKRLPESSPRGCSQDAGK